jgi:hypothetical protein
MDAVSPDPARCSYDLNVSDDDVRQAVASETGLLGLLDQLEHGPLHRFADYATLTGVIPGSGAGVYTVWDDAGGLVYAGIAGRNPAGKGLVSRLRSHASGRRSGDQFCVYVADHYGPIPVGHERVGRRGLS